MGTHPEDGEGPGKFSIQGRKATETDGWDLGLPASGRGTGGSGDKGDKEVGHQEAEHGRTIYCNTADSGTL